MGSVGPVTGAVRLPPMLAARPSRMRGPDIAKPLRRHNRISRNHLHPGRARGRSRGRPRGARGRSETRSATLPPMSFKPDELALLEGAEEVDIETHPPEGPVHRATIWVVVDGDSAYIRSVRGPAGRWYRELVANPAGGLHVDGKRLAVARH